MGHRLGRIGVARNGSNSLNSAARPAETQAVSARNHTSTAHGRAGPADCLGIGGVAQGGAPADGEGVSALGSRISTNHAAGSDGGDGGPDSGDGGGVADSGASSHADNGAGSGHHVLAWRPVHGEALALDHAVRGSDGAAHSASVHGALGDDRRGRLEGEDGLGHREHLLLDGEHWLDDRLDDVLDLGLDRLINSLRGVKGLGLGPEGLLHRQHRLQQRLGWLLGQHKARNRRLDPRLQETLKGLLDVDCALQGLVHRIQRIAQGVDGRRRGQVPQPVVLVAVWVVVLIVVLVVVVLVVPLYWFVLGVVVSLLFFESISGNLAHTASLGLAEEPIEDCCCENLA